MTHQNLYHDIEVFSLNGVGEGVNKDTKRGIISAPFLRGFRYVDNYPGPLTINPLGPGGTTSSATGPFGGVLGECLRHGKEQQLPFIEYQYPPTRFN